MMSELIDGQFWYHDQAPGGLNDAPLTAAADELIEVAHAYSKGSGLQRVFHVACGLRRWTTPILQ